MNNRAGDLGQIYHKEVKDFIEQIVLKVRNKMVN